MSRIWTYFSNSTVHGFNYIADERRHWTERLFWILTCFISAYATWQYLQATWYAYNHNAVSFVTDTTYLSWNTSFLSLSVCEQESPDKLYESAAKIYGDDRNPNIDFYLRDIAFYDGACYSCIAHCQKETLNCSTNYDTIIREVRAQCKDLIGNCSWNKKPFECCDQFLPVTTENGVCFIINSLHTTKRDGEKLKMISNRQLGPGRLTFTAYESIKLYIHSPEDIPYVNHPQEEKFLLSWGTSFFMRYQVKEIENDPLLKEVAITQRNCRFPDENNLHVYDIYSNSACIVNCRAEAILKKCNCTPHYLRISGTPICGVEGLSCVTEYSEMFRSLKTYDFNKLGLVCNCVPSCTEPEYNVLTLITDNGYFENQDDQDDQGSNYESIVDIRLDRLPNERLKRNVVRSRMDLIVSIGGTLGLFLGMSLLSIVEIIYYFIVWTHGKPQTINIKSEKSIQNINNLPFLH
ncbi:Epithelial sodium channel,Epithelial sodium channel, conserved site [Cinara cedri]|uniref:Epithelial sodium channel,Epithelial sodium channel, conserved site n=1 Tax=Cinara cedri TaxID=506608 RepID=A0A5E4M8E1_9HEMI|nr:Epithelial sodium channel,Epithelial sodium channel, conserved site [Cinara cedri]